VPECSSSDGRHERDEPIAVNSRASVVDHAAAVHVGIEDDPQVRTVGQHGVAGERHGSGILRVGHVVGEHAVGLQVQATRCVGAELLQDIPREEATAAVAGVHDDLEALQRGVVVRRVRDALLDDVTEVLGVGAHEVDTHYHRRRAPAAEAHLPGHVPLRRAITDLLDVHGGQPAALGEELEAVAGVGQV